MPRLFRVLATRPRQRKGPLPAFAGQPAGPAAGRLQLIAVIEDPAVIERILRHLGLPTDIPEARPARPPPMPFLLDGLATAGGDDQMLVDTRS